MKQIWSGIQIAFAAFGGFLGWFLGGVDGFLYALIAFTVIDYITGVMCAITAADMALAGIASVIPADEVVVAMGEVGAALPCSLRETAQGGLAATPTGLRLAEEIFGRK